MATLRRICIIEINDIVTTNLCIQASAKGLDYLIITPTNYTDMLDCIEYAIQLGITEIIMGTYHSPNLTRFISEILHSKGLCVRVYNDIDIILDYVDDYNPKIIGILSDRSLCNSYDSALGMYKLFHILAENEECRSIESLFKVFRKLIENSCDLIVVLDPRASHLCNLYKINMYENIPVIVKETLIIDKVHENIMEITSN